MGVKNLLNGDDVLQEAFWTDANIETLPVAVAFNGSNTPRKGVPPAPPAQAGLFYYTTQGWQELSIPEVPVTSVAGLTGVIPSDSLVTALDLQVGDITNLSSILSGKADALAHTNALFVSPAGNDASAAKGRYDKPYLSGTAALAAAASGDTIVVLPGTYTDGAGWQNLGKNNVNWHFMAGAHVNVGGAYSIFSDGGTTMSFNVGGDGIFTNAAANGSGNQRIVTLLSSGSSIRFSAQQTTLTAAAGFGGVAFQTSGSLTLDIQQVTIASGTFLMDTQSSAVTSIEVNRLLVSGGINNSILNLTSGGAHSTRFGSVDVFGTYNTTTLFALSSGYNNLLLDRLKITGAGSVVFSVSGSQSRVQVGTAWSNSTFSTFLECIGGVSSIDIKLVELSQLGTLYYGDSCLSNVTMDQVYCSQPNQIKIQGMGCHVFMTINKGRGIGGAEVTLDSHARFYFKDMVLADTYNLVVNGGVIDIDGYVRGTGGSPILMVQDTVNSYGTRLNVHNLVVLDKNSVYPGIGVNAGGDGFPPEIRVLGSLLTTTSIPDATTSTIFGSSRIYSDPNILYSDDILF